MRNDSGAKQINEESRRFATAAFFMERRAGASACEGSEAADYRAVRCAGKDDHTAMAMGTACHVDRASILADDPRVAQAHALRLAYSLAGRTGGGATAVPVPARAAVVPVPTG